MCRAHVSIQEDKSFSSPLFTHIKVNCDLITKGGVLGWSTPQISCFLWPNYLNSQLLLPTIEDSCPLTQTLCSCIKSLGKKKIVYWIKIYPIVSILFLPLSPDWCASFPQELVLSGVPPVPNPILESHDLQLFFWFPIIPILAFEFLL